MKMKTKEVIIMVVICVVLWRVPLLFLDFGVVWAALLPVIAFIVSSFLVKVIVRRGKKK